MRILFRFVTLFLLLPGVARAQSTEPGNAPVPWTAPAGSVELWNGHDLAGWTPFSQNGAVTPGKFWSAERGVLHLSATRPGYLRTEKAFSNYHLHAEWRWPPAAAAGTSNGGIVVGLRPSDAVGTAGIRVLLRAGSAGDLVAQGGVVLAPGSTDPSRKHSADANEKPPGKWNGVDLYCRRASLEVFINGRRQNLVDPLPFDSGGIALQPEGCPVDFRNVWLEPMCSDAATPLEWSVGMAHSEMARDGRRLWARPKGTGRWDYTMGLYADALIRLSQRTNDPTYEKSAQDLLGSFISPDGKIATYHTKPAKPERDPDDSERPRPKRANNTQIYSLDNIQAGVATLELYALTGQERFRRAADLLRKQLATQPRVKEGGFWHKKAYKQQMWLDGLYMAEPFYAAYAARFREPRDFDDVAKQFQLIATHTYDPVTGLFYHGWDETGKEPWANPQTGASPTFWSRSIGWYAMALVDVLDTLPADHPARPDLVDLLRKVAAGLRKYQDARTGLWWQVTDQGARANNYLEASASCMFVYALAKGVNQGYLPRADIPAIRAGYQGIIRQFILLSPDQHGISLTRCCEVAILDAKFRGSYDYYARYQPTVANDLKGVGPFITAGLECDKLFGNDVFSSGPDAPAPGAGEKDPP